MTTRSTDGAEDARHRFVDRMGDLGVASGMPRMAARLLAYLLTVDEARATAAELAAGLEASPAAISGAVRYLETLGLVRRTRERGSRRDVFEMDEGTWAAYLVASLDVVKLWGSVFEEGAAALDPGGAQSRLQENADLFAYLADQLAQSLAGWPERRDRVARERAEGSA